MFGLGCGFDFGISDEDPVCNAQETNCGGSCVDTQSSADHCGACGIECGTNEACESGVCVSQLPCDRGSCAEGRFCNPETQQCEPGCDSDAQCSGEQFCNTQINECVCPGELVACGVGRCCEQISGETRLSQSDHHNTLEMSLDTSGRVHLVTQPADSQAIEYLVADDGDSFEAETVFTPDAPAEIPGGQTIDVDPTGTPNIAYLTDIDDVGRLYHARRVDSGWTIELVDLLDGGQAIPSILVPAADEVHIAYRSAQPELAYYAFESGEWSESIETGEFFWGAPQLAMDRDGAIRMGIWAEETAMMHIIDPIDFSSGSTFDSGAVARAPALEFDSRNQPHVVYSDFDHFELNYATLADGEWSTERLGEARMGSDPRMVLDSEDQPHIVWIRSESSQVLYTWRDADRWHRRVVGETIEGSMIASERWVDIEMANGDVPVLAYVRADGRIRVIRLQQ
jgi:hypothetical protein